MDFNDYISLISLIVSAIAFFYTYISNTKRYEISSSYRKEILDWYAKTVEILIILRNEIDKPNNEVYFRELKSKLSSLIEIGRFYFPNIDKEDGYGQEKPLAYRGYRNLMLDFLVYSYRIFDKKDPSKYINHLEVLQRQFTSHLFEVLNPRGFLSETKKYTNKTFSKDFIFEDFLDNEPESYDYFFKD